MSCSNDPAVKILFFSDTHLGFDYPLRKTTRRTFRGEDFFSNFQYVLDFAVKQNVSSLVHGGDLFFRSKIPPLIVNRVYQKIIDFSKHQIPLFIVPGNHERSNLPPSLFFENPYLNIFNTLKTYQIHLNNDSFPMDIALTGFPYQKNIRTNFKQIMNKIQPRLLKSQLNLLCMHHIVEGASIGPGNYTFKNGDEVIPRDDIPDFFNCILCGHIHRRQVLWKNREKLNIPIIFSGSSERTSFAEKDEPKGFYIIEFRKEKNWTLTTMNFNVLKTRPMKIIELTEKHLNLSNLNQIIIKKCESFPATAIVKVKIRAGDLYKKINLRNIKSKIPQSMIINIQYPHHQ